jgi:hypothetical protein
VGDLHRREDQLIHPDRGEGFGPPRGLRRSIVKIRFTTQAVIGTHVYGDGSVVELDDSLARFAMNQGYAVEHAEPVAKPAVREATSTAPANARKATVR